MISSASEGNLSAFATANTLSLSLLSNRFKITAEKTIDFNVQHNSIDDFDDGNTKRQHHTTDIVPQNFIEVNIDFKQRGLGGG